MLMCATGFASAWSTSGGTVHAKLHLPGKGRPSEAMPAKQMLNDVLAWLPDRKLVFLADGAYSTKINQLKKLPESRSLNSVKIA